MDIREIKETLKNTKLEGKNLKIAAIVGAGVLLAVVVLYNIAGMFTLENRTARTTNSVQRFIDASLNPLRSDARFAEVLFAPSGEEVIFVQGSTKELKDCEDLRLAVVATSPPMPVKYMITYNEGKGVFEANDNEGK